jgi:hypothetical protein
MASSLVAHHITVVHTKTCPFAQLKDINRDDDRDLGVQGEAKYKLLSIYEESRREKPQAEVSFVVETLCTCKPHSPLAGPAVLLGLDYKVQRNQKLGGAKVLQYCRSSHM